MVKIKKLLIIANGGHEDAAFIRAQAARHDFTLALDGGADTALKAGVTPHLALGDLDSISAAAKRKLGPLKLFKIARQDNTDLEKGLDFAAFLKPQSATIICATGGRIDFTLGNFSSVFGYIKKLSMVIKGKGWRIYPLTKTQKFECKKGATVSLIPVGVCRGLTLKNLKYPLQNASLAPGRTAISNTALKNNFEVILKTGKLLVIIYD
jgi:thiamine pyrophosphokinase